MCQMKKTVLLAGLLGIVMIAGVAAKAFAHCDTMEGPVIKEAKAALETKDITPLCRRHS